MSDFHKEQEHDKHFALLFNSSNLDENKFKHQCGDKVKTYVIRDKIENRVSSMLQSAGQLGASMVDLQSHAIVAIVHSTSFEEAVIIQLGFMKPKPSGVVICPDCLDKAIFTCEENLAVLKDLREATKDY